MRKEETMLDYIFISPLGWSVHVWDKIINSMHLTQNDYEVVEFLNDSYEDITIENIFKDLQFPKQSENYDEISHYLETNAYYIPSMDIFDSLWDQYVENN